MNNEQVKFHEFIVWMLASFASGALIAWPNGFVRVIGLLCVWCSLKYGWALARRPWLEPRKEQQS